MTKTTDDTQAERVALRKRLIDLEKRIAALTTNHSKDTPTYETR